MNREEEALTTHNVIKHIENFLEVERLQYKNYRHEIYKLKNDIRKQDEQLQAYKDKEDKLREYINGTVRDTDGTIWSTDIEKLLQILDGSDE